MKNYVCPICSKIHNSGNKLKYCPKHFGQYNKYGKTLDNNPRTIYDKNEYRIEGNITYIKVYDINCNELPYEVIVDTEEAIRLLKYKIYVRLHKGNILYAYCSLNRNKKEKIHKILCESNTTVDHINGNTLDNRKSNLRPANMSIQNLNKISTKGIQCSKNKKGNICGYAGTMTYNGKRYISKYYKTENEAKYYRYLLLQLLPFETNYNLDFIKNLSEEQKNIINKDFENRFKNRVL